MDATPHSGWLESQRRGTDSSEKGHLPQALLLLVSCAVPVGGGGLYMPPSHLPSTVQSSG